ncbi:MAG: DUF3883 domain-containing protein, partial [Elusimicrobiota bacterium]
SPADKKRVGDNGEMEVYIALQREYRGKGTLLETDFGFKVNHNNEEFEIIWLNKHHNIGKGCDFVIKKNNNEIEYIEVKAKVGESDELIEVTGPQWEFARKLYENDEGEKYSFHIVSNTGKPSARIKKLKNPIKLWKEGKLYADPVKFKL